MKHHVATNGLAFKFAKNSRAPPIAKIVPLAAGSDDQAELMELFAEGAARPPRSGDPLPRSFWSKPLPKARLNLVDLIRDDRNGR